MNTINAIVKYVDKKQQEDKTVKDLIARVNEKNSNNPVIHPREGDMQYLMRTKAVKLDEVRRKYREKDQLLYWNDRTDGNIEAASARAIDGKIFFSNGFLTNYKPFNVSQPWLVMLAVAKRAKYKRDDEQFSGDTWLTAEQLWLRREGDCEDHAILIADWLIQMGHDARVVIGRTKKSGHAWVVVFSGDDTYVIESTNKYPKRIAPHQEFVTDLFPIVMFNKTDFWFNKAGEKNLNYRSSEWIKSGKFIESNNSTLETEN